MVPMVRNAVQIACTGALLALAACGDHFDRGEPYLTGAGSSGTAGSDGASSGGAGLDLGGASSGDATTGTETGASSSGSGGDATAGTGTTGAGTGGGADEVCYPGPNRDWSLCLPVVELDPVPPEYEYGPAYQDNPNYRPPIRFLDLQALDPSTKLAPNFTLDEVAQLSKGPYAVMQPHAIESLQGLRDQIGAITVNSGYRSPAYNQMIGGATYSRHMYGDAFDIKAVNAPMSDLEMLCQDAGGMLVQYTTHVHCDFRFDPVDEVFFGPADGWMPVAPPPMAAHLELSGQVWTAPAWGFDEGEPRRVWVARGAGGQVLARGEGREFVAPPGARAVEVIVGGQIELGSTDAAP